MSAMCRVAGMLAARRSTLLVALLCTVAAASPAQARFNAKKAIWGPASVNGQSQFPLYKQLGVGIFQETLSWRDIATARPAHPTDPADPAYRWPVRVDTAIREAQANGMRSLLMLQVTPAWANGDGPGSRAPKNAKDLADFARAAAKRYPTVHLWMIWGEPTKAINFDLVRSQLGFPLTTAQRAAPRRYARMLDASYSVLTKASPKNLVIGGNTYTTGDVTTVKWIQALRLPNGKPPRMDLYGHNPFSNREPNLSNGPSANERIDFSDLGRLRTAVAKYLGRPRHKSIRLFLSEWTIPTAIDDEFNFYVDLDVQAKWIRSAFSIVNGAKWIYALGWIHVYDDPPSSIAGLFDKDGSPKPGAQAFTDG
jgi:hypothetical protein